MPEQPPSGSPALPEVQARLQTITRLLRETPHLGPEAQATLAELVDELGQTLASASVSSVELRHLADSTEHLVQALGRHPDRGPLAAARDRLEQAVVRAEAHAPVAAGIARRLLDALANLGI